MLFRFLRVFVGIVLRSYFRKMPVLDSENLPKDKPLIIASNHPASFMEACVLACYMPIIVHFMTRGDVFESSFRFFLVKTNQIPIYRARDGMESLRKNITSFKWANRLLSEKERIVIFCEGTAKLTKHLRTVQKGASRIAYDAIKEYPDLDLRVVPIGVNFHELKRFRSTGIVKIGEAIDPRKYIDLEKNEKYERLTADIQAGLQPQMTHITDMKDEEWIDVFLKIYHDKSLEKGVSCGGMFDDLQNLVNYLEDNKNLKEVAIEYKKECETHGFVVGPSYKKLWNSVFGVLKLMVHAILAIISIPGAIVFTPIFLWCRRFAYKKTKNIEFTIAVLVGLLFGTTFLFSIVTTIVLMIISVKLYLIVLIGMIISTWSYLKVIDFWNLNRNSFKALLSDNEISRSLEQKYRELSDILIKYES